MYKIIYSVCLALSIALGACQSSENEEERLFKEVMDLHDDIMPKVGRFVRYNASVDSLIQGLPGQKEANPALDTAAERSRLLAVQSTIEAANEAMMKWMADFEQDAGASAQASIDYLSQEKEKLEALQLQFKEAEALMDQHPLR